jgi:hydrogenase/urease accessory protein HupE
MNSSKVIRLATLATAALSAAAAWAHPNHAEPGTTTTLFHLLTEPDHALAIVAAIGVGVWAVLRGRARGRAVRKHLED